MAATAMAVLVVVVAAEAAAVGHRVVLARAAAVSITRQRQALVADQATSPTPAPTTAARPADTAATRSKCTTRKCEWLWLISKAVLQTRGGAIVHPCHPAKPKTKNYFTNDELSLVPKTLSPGLAPRDVCN